METGMQLLVRIWSRVSIGMVFTETGVTHRDAGLLTLWLQMTSASVNHTRTLSISRKVTECEKSRANGRKKVCS